MSPWTDVSAALVALFTDLSKDAARATLNYSAMWREGAQQAPHEAQGFKLELKVTTVAGIGEDETRYEFDEGTQTQTSFQYCLRRITLQVTATATQALDGRHPMAVLERVRTRLGRPSSKSALAAVGLSFVRMEPALDVTYTFDNKRRPAAVMDVVLTGAFTDEDPVDAGWIQYVEVGSHHDGSADSPIEGEQWIPEEPPP